jgi:hypothetical protein
VTPALHARESQLTRTSPSNRRHPTAKITAALKITTM